MKLKKLFLPILTAVILALAGCSSNKSNEDEQSHSNDNHTQHAENGDIQEKTSSVEKLPTFLADKPEEMQLVYSAAAKHKDLLESMPCYCGCGESANHKNNYDCFVFKNNEDGSIVWDDHGTRCGVCQEIAAESVVLLNKGKTPVEIRKYIDEKYKEGYAKPTPTPMPKA
ncbi:MULTISPECIES: PCYCGC motif-containing (lipo)protein [Bacillus]|uniref:PCYCGC motif-containing (lipo)protein n=1 Tax=Bacillus TaxID=1386 RepID=UPI0002EB7A1B|nr:MULTISPECIES: PCYCGC motif-containing (lipo)protein [Bacillus]